MTFDAVDLFAGPGGWDVAARWLGMDVAGIEFEDTAVATRLAAGLPTWHGDVRDYRPLADGGLFPGFIASPPCPTFSAAGNGSGRRQLDDVLRGIRCLINDTPLPDWEDERTGLTLEPMVWLLTAFKTGRPHRWVALEQVPAVLPVWQAYADVLRVLGYSVAVGNVQAEQYGVPQTRKRAVLLAALDRPVVLPAPTHSRYHNRNPQRLDEGVPAWVSMADALGPTTARLIQWRGAGMVERHGDRPARVQEQPAFAITGGNTGSGPLRWQYPSTLNPGEWASIRMLTVTEAACLQTFPHDHPWAVTTLGQVSNAVPPLLALHLLAKVTGRPLPDLNAMGWRLDNDGPENATQPVA